MLRIIVVGLVVLVAAMFLLPRGGGLRLQPEVATMLPEPRELFPLALRFCGLCNRNKSGGNSNS